MTRQVDAVPFEAGDRCEIAVGTWAGTLVTVTQVFTDSSGQPWVCFRLLELEEASETSPSFVCCRPHFLRPVRH